MKKNFITFSITALPNRGYMISICTATSKGTFSYLLDKFV